MIRSGIGKFSRYFVPDLSPMDREELRSIQPKVVFVAESPHTSEIAPEARSERRPLCGAAGRKWWALLGELCGEEPNEDVSLARLIRLCRKSGVIVLNAVQYPLDQGISKQVPGADPIENLGFSKNAGASSYKKLKQTEKVQRAVQALRERLEDPSLRGAEIHCLGNDAEWFVKQALPPDEYEERVKERLPHPSAWWRRGGYFGRLARESLGEILRNLEK